MLQLNFFDTTKQWKELFILIEIRKNSHISQADLTEVLDVSPAMVSKYITSMEDRGLIQILKITQKDYQYALTRAGIDCLNTLMNRYLSEISALKNLFKHHIDRFQKEYELKVAITNSFGTLMPYIADKLGFFEQNQMRISLMEYSNGEKLMEDFERNKFDMALLGSVPAYLWKTYGAAINVIASVDSGGHAIITKRNIKDISGLKGKNIIIPENTTVTNNVFRIFIKKHPEYHIDYDQDLSIKNVPIDRIEEEIKNESVDAIILWEPHVSSLLYKNKEYKMLYDFSKHDNRYISNVVAVNESFNYIYKDTVNRFLETLSLTIDYYEDHINEVDQIIAKKLDLSLEIIQKARARTRFQITKII